MRIPFFEKEGLQSLCWLFWEEFTLQSTLLPTVGQNGSCCCCSKLTARNVFPVLSAFTTPSSSSQKSRLQVPSLNLLSRCEASS